VEGEKRREKGLAKAGNARVRGGMIQLAWRFLLFQKNSARSLFARRNFARKKFGEARDWAGIFGRGAFRARETALPRISGGKATESQRLFRRRQEAGVAHGCVVAEAVPFGPVSAGLSLVTGNFLHFWVKNRPPTGSWRPALPDLLIAPVG
jgi:hypothetical protein